MKAQKEWLTRFGVAVDDADGAVTEECCEVSGFMYEHVFVPEIFVGSSCRVVEVIDCAHAESVEVVIAAFERTEIRQRAEVPLADERRSVTCFSEQRRQRRMLGWEADGIDALDSSGTRCGNRFFQANAKPVLIASGDERRARCRTDCGIGVALSEADAAGGDAVDVRCLQIGAAVASHIGVTEIISHDEEDVRQCPTGLPKNVANSGCDRQ
jgi:hypothetical protein